MTTTTPRHRVSPDPLVRTAWPLLLNTGTNALLGVAYWLAAARLYDEESVAANTAVISAMATLSGIAQLNLGQGLAVLLPRASGGTHSVLLRVYAVVTLFGLVVVGVFLVLVLPHLDALDEALSGGARLTLFVVGVLALNLFAMQDAALVALRRGRLVPAENAVFGALKLALLVLFVTLSPGFGIYVSWVLPMLLLVPVVSGFVLFRRRSPEPDHGVPPVSETSRRLALDYVGYLFHVCSTVLLPVVALELLPPVQAAVFSVAWLTVSTVDLLSYNVGTALTVEASYGHDPLALRRSVLRRGLPLMGAVAVAGIVVAPFVLHLYGPRYADEGVVAMRILLCATVARALVTFAIAEARAHGHVGTIVWLRAQNSAIALLLAFLLAPRFGPEGLALAWLCAQVAGGAFALHRLVLRPMRLKLPS